MKTKFREIKAQDDPARYSWSLRKTVFRWLERQGINGWPASVHIYTTSKGKGYVDLAIETGKELVLAKVPLSNRG